jgi:hypothetical protein
MQKQHPELNVLVAGRRSARRADLYVIASKQVVSIEFKYVTAAGLRDVGGCAAQLGRHAGQHARALLVLYCGTAVIVPDRTVSALVQSAGRPNARVVMVNGPEIAVATGTA